MMLRNVLLTALSCTVLVFAAGNGMNSDTNYNGQDGQGGMDGSQMSDTMMAMGIIEQYDEAEGMMIVSSDMGMDTIYFSNETVFPQDKAAALQQGNQIVVKYVDKDGKKIATEIMTPEELQNGQGESEGMEQDTSGMPPEEYR